MLKNSSSILGFRVCKFTLFGGMIPFSNASTVLMTPATPLAPSKCPIFDFTDPLNLILEWIDQTGVVVPTYTKGHLESGAV